MAVGQRTTYYFLGRHPVQSAPTLEEAIRDLVDWWTRQPSLVPHELGNLIIAITIGGTTVQFEITDPDVLDEARYTGPMAVIDYLSKQMGIDEKDAREILESAEATVEVNAIRVPGDPDAWKPDPGMAADEVLPESAPALLREMAREEDIDRDVGAPRTARGRHLVEVAVRTAEQLGISLTQMSRDTGIPRTTLRDARNRMEREQRVKAAFKDRTPGQRLTAEQISVVVSELRNNENNAAATARALGIAPRTVREIRQRASTPAPTSTGRSVGVPRRKYTESDRAKLLDLVKGDQISATEAARQLGVPSRTARGWVRQARLEAEED